MHLGHYFFDLLSILSYFHYHLFALNPMSSVVMVAKEEKLVEEEVGEEGQHLNNYRDRSV